jgi:hypothetical protein
MPSAVVQEDTEDLVLHGTQFMMRRYAPTIPASIPINIAPPTSAALPSLSSPLPFPFPCFPLVFSSDGHEHNKSSFYFRLVLDSKRGTFKTHIQIGMMTGQSGGQMGVISYHRPMKFAIITSLLDQSDNDA